DRKWPRHLLPRLLCSPDRPHRQVYLDNVCCAVKRWGVFKPHCWPLFLLMIFFAGKAFPAVDPLAVEPDAIPVSGDYVLRTWGVDEGLPSNRVTGLTQTPDG